MYNYVYRITNKIENKHYYGCRTSKIEPKLDLGIKYFSSSSDKEFKLDQNENPLNYKYKIIKIFNIRTEAIKLEIKLHKKFNVGINESFYNRARQTSIGFDFDCTNKPHSEEAKKKMSESKTGKKGKPHLEETKLKMSKSKQNMSDETKAKMSKSKIGKLHYAETKKKIGESNKGKTHSDEAKLKMSEAKKGKPRTPYSEEHKQKISESLKNKKQELLECSYCGKIGGRSIMTRWHFDNCKFKIEEILTEI